LACVDFDGTAALAALDRHGDGSLDEPFRRRTCGPTLAAIDHICAWLRA
jgi:hypothetical protein